MRRVRRKGASKDKVFGCDLLQHLNATGQEVPQVLRCCSQFVEEHGVVDGIYRLSGVSSNIQKLRSEFEGDRSPDLSKEVYLQDIHCVSSLCKAYFRELPNPLLTYQLYDKFAEAVAVQLEEERLVKIRDVLKELPPPHYRTLEFLMCHLVKMASYSPETNMHARNLAIVWAPNLLRSKDIEVSGFSGTAAFMEVRVQSIVVEFILTHVPELFPEPNVTHSRRKSLPSPTAISSQEETLFKPPANFGHISPGDSPIPIRPYHAIIEGTDKRKGSFKGRKWISIFNIGSRFHDPRRRHKHSAKEKDASGLRPARSMDSLSITSYSNEDSIRPLQTSRSTKMSGLEPAASRSPLGGSEYAVTYRRGTGLMSGGTQGTYTALDPEGLGGADSDSVQSSSPGISTKAGRRAAMHITGPTMVTVPLHITSNLALGLLQGGGSDRVVHRGKDKDGNDQEGDNYVQRKDSGRMEMKVKELKEAKAETKEVAHGKEIIVDEDANTLVDKEEEAKNEEAIGEDCRAEPAVKEIRAKSLSYDVNEDVCQQYVHEEMEGVPSAKCEDNNIFDSSGVLNSTEVEQDDHELSGYVQDNFEFLDHMDCSVSCQIPLHFLPDCTHQVNEFSVEPPGHSDDEFELIEQPPLDATGPDVRLSVSSKSNVQSQLKPQRPRSIDANERHAKSLSLPHMTSPVREPEECCSNDDEDDTADDDTADDDTADYYSSDEDSSLFVRSLPADFFLSNVCDVLPEDLPACTADSAPAEQSRQPKECNSEMSADKQQNDGNQSKDDKDRVKETIPQIEKRIDHREEHNGPRNEDLRIKETGPEPLPIEVHSYHCVDLQEHTDESSVKAIDDVNVDKIRQEDDEEEEVHHFSTSEYTKKEISPVERYRDVSGEATEEFKEDQDDGDKNNETEDVNPETIINMPENPLTEDGAVSSSGKTQEGDLGTDDAFGKFWDELEEVVCELIEDEERKTWDVRDSRETNEKETTARKNPEDTDINLPERCGQEGAVVGKSVPTENKSMVEEVNVTTSLGDAPLKEVSVDVPQSGEEVCSEERRSERCEQGQEVTELLVPNEVKPDLEKVTVTSLRDVPIKEVSYDVLQSRESLGNEVQGPERCEDGGTDLEMLVPKDDQPICEEMIMTPRLRESPLKEVSVDVPESGEEVSSEERRSERCEQGQEVTELLVPNEVQPNLEKVTVTASLGDEPQEKITSEVLDTGQSGRFEKQRPERWEQEGMVPKKLVPQKDKPICEEVTMTPSLRDVPMKEVSSDVLQSRERVRFEVQVPERCEDEGADLEKLVPKDDKPICEEIIMTPRLREPPLKEVSSDFPDSREGVSFEERELERSQHQGPVMEKLLPTEDEPICEEVSITPSLRDTPVQEVISDIPESKESVRFEDRGIGRKLVISKLPKVYQVKAVPVVLPKRQHCKLAARSLRQQQQQQQQQQERKDAYAPDDVGANCSRDMSRNSPLSMCFDEAVAIATMRREKERECERERQRDWVGEVQ
ncbi:uncharacterized protein LOC109524090 [Hippocampus comes]|uniref:Si:dkeyp-68b7.12 n=1 Tax=Hippocampus comes TaxID=109280 RepID=A0A3Q2YBH6_HIPCM|nr:PREDICTED: uncharacterized protein LOC109524090 [Hippocampus comes]